MRSSADLERKTYVDRVRRPNLTDQLFGNGLDVADQQIAVDLFEWGFVGEWHVNQHRTLHDLLSPPQA